MICSRRTACSCLWVRASLWWLRSARIDNASDALGVNTNGSSYYPYANNTNALVPGFIGYK